MDVVKPRGGLLFFGRARVAFGGTPRPLPPVIDSGAHVWSIAPFAVLPGPISGSLGFSL